MRNFLYGDAISAKPRNLTLVRPPLFPLVETPRESIVRDPYTVCEVSGACGEPVRGAGASVGTVSGGTAASVTFSLYYPAAKAVSVDIAGNVFALEKETASGETGVSGGRNVPETGYWTGSAAVGEGFFPVRVLVDGNKVLSNMLPIGFSANEVVNFIEVSGAVATTVAVSDESVAQSVPLAGAPSLQLDVPHGSVVQDYLPSAVTGNLERLVVYLPPCYFEEPERKFPVLYLQHGHGENELCWVNQGKVNFIMDSLLARGEAEPCVIVMANGMVTRETGDGVTLRYLDLEPFLLTEIIPFIESRYRVYADKEHRAMAGLSMGSIQTSYITMRNQGLFCAAGLFSGFVADIFSDKKPDEQPHLTQENLATYRENIGVFFRAMGDTDPFIPNFLGDDALLEAAGVDCVRKLYHGGHVWKVWRECFADFARLIFRS